MFRKEVLEELESPEKLSSTIRVTQPSVYLILSTAALMAVVLIVWLFMGSVSDKVHIGGIVFPTRNTANATVPNDAVVRKVFVTAGDTVELNQTLALVSIKDAYSILSSPATGVVIQTKKPNDQIRAFEPIVSIITQDTTTVVRSLTAFADFHTQRKLRKGMAVQVSPVNMPREKYGYVTGRITNISRYAIKREQALEKLHMEDFLKDVFPQEGTAFAIDITLDADPDEPATLNWSFGEPEMADMSIGTFCNVQVITKKRSMFDFLFEQVNQTINQILE